MRRRSWGGGEKASPIDNSESKDLGDQADNHCYGQPQSYDEDLDCVGLPQPQKIDAACKHQRSEDAQDHKDKNHPLTPIQIIMCGREV